MKEQNGAKDRTTILVAIIGFLGVVIAASIPMIKDALSHKKTINRPMEGYNSIKIGSQEWMNRNLATDRYRTGELIHQAKTENEWDSLGKAKSPCWSYFHYDSTFSRYGKFYNFYTIRDTTILNLAPIGWHLPSQKEWEKLVNYLGGFKVAGKKIKTKFGWKNGGVGTNESGFDGISAGFFGNPGGYVDNGIRGMWWSSSECGDFCGISFYVQFSSDSVLVGQSGKACGFNIRCIKN